MGLEFSRWKPEMIGDFNNDKQHNKWVYYYPNGGISYEAHFDNGKKQVNGTISMKMAKITDSEIM